MIILGVILYPFCIHLGLSIYNRGLIVNVSYNHTVWMAERLWQDG